MQVKVTQYVKDLALVDGAYKRVEAEQKLSFGTWDDFQNWQGYTVEALEGKPLKIEISMKKEEPNG